MRLQDDTAAGGGVVFGTDFVLVAVDIVEVRVAFPLVVDLRDGDQLNCLPLEARGEDRAAASTAGAGLCQKVNTPTSTSLGLKGPVWKI